MHHTTPLKESQLAATCWDYAEYNLSNWIDGDEREVTVYMDRRPADCYGCLPFIEVTGAVAHADQFSEVFTRAEFAALIGGKFVAMIEEAKAEECGE